MTLPSDSGAASRPADSLLPRALLAGLQRFSLTRSIQAVSEATRAYCAAEGERLDSELSMIRYIAWPFRRLGPRHRERHRGGPRPCSQSPRRRHLRRDQESRHRFNSTLIALLISLLIMFFIHQLQLIQERYVLDTEAYCEENLTRHLHVP